MKTNKREKVESVAIQQSLRFNYHMTYRKIAGIMRVSERTVWNNCNGKLGVLRWEDRTLKNEANEAAFLKITRGFY